MIPLLERTSGVRYLRISALAEIVLFPALLLAPAFGLKLVLLALVGVVNAGWYPVLQGRLYTAMPGLSGTVTTVGNVFGLAGAALPLALGLVAQRSGLGLTMWLILIAPLAIVVGLPGKAGGRRSSSTDP
jgi:FSR family fosmidomycin resistance protein-like MFS transporter